jgi:hypothetical protein
MVGRERRGADGEDADLPPGRQEALDERHLHQARGRDRHADMARNVLLVDREEAAIGGDPVGSEVDELARRGQEVVEQARGALGHDPPGEAPRTTL